MAKSSEPEYLYLTTTGWKSGKPHAVEIWYAEHNGCFYLISELREQAHWVQNLRHNSKVTWRLGPRTMRGTARVVDPAHEPELAGAVSELFDQRYDWSDGLIVELRPE